MTAPHIINALADLDAAGAAQAERTLPGTYIDVTLTGGRTFTVRISNQDYIAWDKTAPKHKWGAYDTVPFRFATFLAFNAARREGLYTGTHAQFEDEVDGVERREVDGDDAARPTPTAQQPDSL